MPSISCTASNELDDLRGPLDSAHWLGSLSAGCISGDGNWRWIITGTGRDCLRRSGKRCTCIHAVVLQPEMIDRRRNENKRPASEDELNSNIWNHIYDECNWSDTSLTFDQRFILAVIFSSHSGVQRRAAKELNDAFISWLQSNTRTQST